MHIFTDIEPRQSDRNTCSICWKDKRQSFIWKFWTSDQIFPTIWGRVQEIWSPPTSLLIQVCSVNSNDKISLFPFVCTISRWCQIRVPVVVTATKWIRREPSREWRSEDTAWAVRDEADPVAAALSHVVKHLSPLILWNNSLFTRQQLWSQRRWQCFLSLPRQSHVCCARWCPAVLAYALHVCMWGAPSCVFSRIKGTVHVSAYSSHVCMTCRGDIQRLHVLVFYSFKVFTCCKWFDTKFCIRYLQHLEI